MMEDAPQNKLTDIDSMATWPKVEKDFTKKSLKLSRITGIWHVSIHKISQLGKSRWACYVPKHMEWKISYQLLKICYI